MKLEKMEVMGRRSWIWSKYITSVCDILKEFIKIYLNTCTLRSLLEILKAQGQLKIDLQSQSRKKKNPQNKWHLLKH